MQCLMGAVECAKHFYDDKKTFLRTTPLLPAGFGVWCGVRRR